TRCGDRDMVGRVGARRRRRSAARGLAGRSPVLARDIPDQSAARHSNIVDCRAPSAGKRRSRRARRPRLARRRLGVRWAGQSGIRADRPFQARLAGCDPGRVAAGAVYLPFTLVLAVLSRWSGGLADRFGARRPLIVGPAIAAGGFALLAVVSGEQRYWVYLVPMIVLGFGMAITVAPLTTTVINSVTE